MPEYHRKFRDKFNRVAVQLGLVFELKAFG